jgi:crotonobetainyl-CoA:carnitine CoA-transferase CaiB-like acyl-CoA transferase
MADMGATVLKVESPSARGRHPVPGLEGVFDELNRNKRSLALDLGQPAGREIARRLVRWADIVLDNFSARVMASFELDHDKVLELNPRAVVVSMPAYGLTGPYANSVGVGATIEAGSGMAWYCRYGDENEPIRCGPPYPDALAGLNGAFAALFTLLRREWSDRGGSVDLSQFEATVCAIGELVRTSGSEDLPNSSLGDRHSIHAPWGAYPSGDGRWLFVGIETEEQWASFASLAKLPANLTRLAVADRRARRDDLERAMTLWSQTFTADEGERQLQAQGIPAAAVLDAAELVDGASSAAAFVEVELANGGFAKQPRFPLSWDDSSTWQVYARPPQYGENYAWALIDLLEMPNQEIATLLDSGVVRDSVPPVQR